jgi:hypothetical protein
VFNMGLCGDLCPEYWTSSRTVLVPKKGGSLRPLGIGETMYRWMGRTIMKAVGDKVGVHLRQGGQLGCGTKHGGENCARMAQVALDADPNNVLVNVDIKNAFGTLPRRYMMQGILNVVPELAKWFDWAYGRESLLFASNGECAGKNKTGCRQGDPVSGMCFSLGFQFALDELMLKLRELVKELEVTLKAEAAPDEAPDEVKFGLFAYMDDVTVFIHFLLANLVAEWCKVIFGEYRLTLADEKCKIVTSPQLEETVKGHSSTDFQVCGAGTVIMGIPVGGEDGYRERVIKDKVEEMTAVLEALPKLSAVTAFNLLKYCINTRFGYLSKVCEPADCFGAAVAFDDRITKALLLLASGGKKNISDGLPFIQAVTGNVHDKVAELRALPMAMGGLGMMTHSGLIGEKGVLVSRMAAYKHVRKYYPKLVGGTGKEYWERFMVGACLVRDRVTGGLTDEQRQRNMMVEMYVVNEYGELTGEPSLKLYKEEAWVEDLLQGQAADIHGDVVKKQRSMAAAIRAQFAVHQPSFAGWFVSMGFQGSGQWLQGRGGSFFGPYEFKDSEQFCMALRTRLLLHPLDAAAMRTVGGSLRCRCGEFVDLEVTPLHWLDCRCSQWWFTKRHDAVQKAVKGFIKKCRPGKEVTEKPLVGQQADVSGVVHKVFADLSFRDNNQREIFIDVAVSTPSARTYIDLQSTTREDATCLAREENKRSRYIARGVTDEVLQATVFFVVEATGRVGPSAHKFLTRMAGEAYKKEKLQLLQQIGAVITRWDAMLMIARRKWALSQNVARSLIEY